MNAIQRPSKPSLGTRIGDFVFKMLILLAVLLTNATAIDAQDCDLSWESENNVSLSSAKWYGCMTTIRPEDILTNPGACVDDKTVAVFSLNDLSTPIDMDPSMAGAQVDESYMGQRLKCIVTHNSTGAKAEAFVTIEDKTAPELYCNDLVITCLDDSRPILEGGIVPGVEWYDCSSVTKSFEDTYTSYTCVENAHLVGSISREWTVTDAGNEVSTCTQKIDIVRISLATGELEEPADKDVSCSDDLVKRWPENTGYPSLSIMGVGTYDLIPGEEGYCSLDISYTDVQAAGSCPTKELILRSWTIRDLCYPSEDGVNPRTFVQKINIVDNVGPVITSVANMTNGTSNEQCTAVVSFPPATATDACGNATVTIHTAFGDLTSNGGTLFDVPVGVHEVTYRATDDCNNKTDKVITLTVIDDDEPNVVCNQSLVVPLGHDGGAQILATSFDDGSTDNCAIVSYKVARMASACGPETAFDDYVDFTCCDLENNPIMVALKVSDAAGNFNICMVEVTVQDKVAPIITCPPTKELDCTDDYTDTGFTGTPSVSDNCEVDIFYFEDITDLNDCGWGTVVRKWIAEDKSGNISECYQTITITNRDPFDGEDDIIWPQTYNATDCGADLDPDNLLFPYGRPVLDVQDCDNVKSYYIDQAIGDYDGAACYAINRTWTVIDLCIHDPNVPSSAGKWIHVQRINVDDTTDPVFIKGHEDEEILVDGDCRGIEYTIMAEVEDCSPNLTYHYQIDLGNDGSIDSIGTAQMMTLAFFSEGTHKISWRVTDGCGNEASADQLITFTDTKAPNPNLKATFTALMPINGGMIEVNAKDFNNSSSDNCTPIEWLKYSYSADINDVLRTFTCADLGQNTLDIYVHDGAGNVAYATTFVDIQDGNGVCGAVMANVTGMITTPAGGAIANVAVALEGSDMISLMTSADGSYNINNIPQGSFKIKPSKNVEAMNGVSTYDMVLMQRHILGLAEFADPYTMIAADVNNSGSISTSDIVAMRRLILDINEDFGTTQSWRFVVADHNFTSGGTFPEDYPLDNPSSDMQVDFIGIKVGDINSNANTALLGSDEIEGAPLAFKVQDQYMIAGESYTIAFNAKDFQDVIGFQYTLQFDADAIELRSINSGALELGDQNHNLNDSDLGLVATNWYNALPVSIDDEDLLFSVNITAKEDLLLSDVLSIGSEKTRAEAYRQSNINTPLITGDAQIDFIDLDIAIEGYELRQNAPNPFDGATTISIQVPSKVDGRLSIYDVTGKVVKMWNQNFDKGIHRISLTASDLPEGGIYYYQFEAGGYSATKKMVVIR